MPIEDGDQERWDELPSGAESSEKDCSEDRVSHIERVAVHGDTYSYPGPTGTIRVQHEQEKVCTAKLPSSPCQCFLFRDVCKICMLTVQQVLEGRQWPVATTDLLLKASLPQGLSFQIWPSSLSLASFIEEENRRHEGVWKVATIDSCGACLRKIFWDNGMNGSAH